MKTKNKIVLLCAGLLLLSALLIAAVPDLQSYTPFANIRVRGDSQLTTLSVSGAATFNGSTTLPSLQPLTGGLSVAPNVVVSAPTAIATATPALYVNNAGAHNALVIAKNATPNFTVGNGGVVTGLVLQYASSGQRVFCATNTITDTASYTTSTHAVTTPTFALCTLGAVTADANGCGAAFGQTSNVTVTIKNSAVTPAANAAGAAVTWCVLGTP